MDDLDGTVIEEKIYHMAGAQTPQQMAQAELVRAIREAGREPVQRDSLYPAGRSRRMSWRIGSIPYLNVRPLIYGIEDRVVSTVPSRLAELLHHGQLDVGIVPIAEVLRHDQYDILDSIAIGANGPVRSVLLFHREPIAHMNPKWRVPGLHWEDANVGNSGRTDQPSEAPITAARCAVGNGHGVRDGSARGDV